MFFVVYPMVLCTFHDIPFRALTSLYDNRVLILVLTHILDFARILDKSCDAA